MFLFNAQHDCYGSRCTLIENAESIYQERERTSCTRAAIRHADDKHFFLNMHSLHNAHRIRQSIPRALTQPKPYFEDREAKHNEFAAELRVTGPLKRADALSRSKATRAQKKAQKEAEDAEVAGVGEAGEVDTGVRASAVAGPSTQGGAGTGAGFDTEDSASDDDANAMDQGPSKSAVRRCQTVVTTSAAARLITFGEHSNRSKHILLLLLHQSTSSDNLYLATPQTEASYRCPTCSISFDIAPDVKRDRRIVRTTSKPKISD